MTTPENNEQPLPMDTRFNEREFKHFVNQVAEHLNSNGGQQVQLKHDTSGTLQSGFYGPGGMLSDPYSRPDMWSTLLTPQSFISMLPRIPTRVANEVQKIITGITQGTKVQSPTTCGPGDVPGYLKSIDLVRKFGHMKITSQPRNLSEIGLYDTRGTQQHSIINYQSSRSPFVPDPLRQMNPTSDAARQLWEAGVQAEDSWGLIEITGDNAVTGVSAEIGWQREFDGLDQLIADNLVGAYGNQSDAIDSLVVAWNAAFNATGTGPVAGLNLPQAYHAAYWSRKQLARKAGINNPSWAWVGDERLWYQLTFLVACTYVYAGCAGASDAQPIQRQASEIERRAIEMQNGMFLPVNGERVPFVPSSGAEVLNDADPEGTLFLVPMTGMGRPLTYVEYFDMSNSDLTAYLAATNEGGVRASNNGMYLINTSRTGGCIQITLEARPRLMVDAPFLGARFDGVEFPGYLGFRNAIPGRGSWVNGGSSFWSSPFVG